MPRLMASLLALVAFAAPRPLQSPAEPLPEPLRVAPPTVAASGNTPAPVQITAPAPAPEPEPVPVPVPVVARHAETASAAGSTSRRLGLDQTVDFDHPPTERLCDTIAQNARPAGSEKARIAACAGQMDDETRAHVARVMMRRIAKRRVPGFDRFVVLGASASRAPEYLTGFGSPKTYSLTPDWEFLRGTIEHFDERGRHSSFARKDATCSGTTAGNFLWRQSFCPDCPDRLQKELQKRRPAFALVMFGTNNVSWGGAKGLRRFFNRRIAAGWRDPWCRKGGCLPPWEPGETAYHHPGLETRLGDYVSTVLDAKVSTFRKVYSILVSQLLARDVVPLLSTIPPMPRKWLDEDTVYAINAEIRAIARKKKVPVMDLWCAMSPTTQDAAGRERLDWAHPIMSNNKGIGPDRYHPQKRAAFRVADENLIYGYNVRNVMTLLRLHELRELTAELEDKEAGSHRAADAGPR